MIQPPPSTDPASLLSAQIARLVLLRWWSVGMMLVSVLLLPGWLGLSLRTGPPLAVALALVAINLFSLAALKAGVFRSSKAVFMQLLLDLIGWSVFVYLTGGATNPLISLLLPLLAIGATVLPAAMAWTLAGLGMLSYSLLWQFNQPIRMADPQVAAYWHLLGMWITFAVSALVMVGFVLRMTAALRERDRALALASAHRARDEHLVALGNLAAGAAHSLGTPLGTIRLLADELAQDLTLPATVREDVALIGEQVDHCRQTLALLTARAGNRRAEGGGRVRVQDWARSVIDSWQRQRPQVTARVACDPALADVEMVGDEALAQALHTLVNNAADACPLDVEVDMRLRDRQLVFEVLDRGAGVPEHIRNDPGDRPVAEGGSGMGIGLFLARAVIARAGGELTLVARAGGGTVARMTLPLERLQT